MTSFPDAVTQTLADIAESPEQRLAVLSHDLDLLAQEVSRRLLRQDTTTSELTLMANRLTTAFTALRALTVRIEAQEAHTTAIRRFLERNASEWR